MQHGGDLTDAKARFGEGDPPWLDLSTGINPHPWPIPADRGGLGWERLPSRADDARLLAAARRAYAVPDAIGIVAAPGSQTLIQWLPRLAGDPRRGRVAIVGPTYGEHEISWRSAGFAVDTVPDLASLPPAVSHSVVVNPNNPDGLITPIPTLLAAARHCYAQGGFLVVDESFADLDPSLSVVPHLGEPPIVVLRSFGKFYGLAGLRLGFAIAPARLSDAVRAALGPWAVSGPALTIGSAALADDDWRGAARERLRRDSEALDGVLRRSGLAVVGGTSLYRLVSHKRAHALHEALAAEHVWVRRFDEQPDRLRFGLPPDEAALVRLAAALAAAGRSLA